MINPGPMSGPLIDYTLIANALGWYNVLKYQYVDTPWSVSEEAINATLPPNGKAFGLGNKFLVGSAEQGFIQLLLDGKIGQGNYISAGPCFRDDFEDKYHFKYFFKVELIKIQGEKYPIYDNSVLDMVNQAASVYKKLFDIYPEITKTYLGYDLTVEGIEIGSYGIREYKDWKWFYGTGLALPRALQAMDEYESNNR